MSKTRKLSLAGAVLQITLILVGGYFGLAAIQGDSGLFERIQIEAEADELRLELAALQAETAHLETLTRRMSDTFLDLDLLDEQAREILGYLRADEIVLR
ncbi:MAG: septum formation initiator family protein [Rhodobacteraceae bacterium]|jgi:cell division protein FtsB|uniref:FtsB family cell division protein n=1 Tax=Roseovarius sp. 10 TaxID=3080563 RepID=UPI001A019199|nr:septum formation initiator family protein [Roseovarius sp. 10]MBE1288670.1 septum formation initiator family protein [Paracoccaceae bacterium]MBF9022677.1 septum formation initiator family protein [Rhodobacterales bacterium FZCC0069]MBF9028222.1 septum formation initiator family protein [Rhodobacterales bacterium FZCC0188]MBF9053312.1 septum formation initiator family protein [Rhodobacterales bacterium LSUCC1028]MDV7199778.1 septum formation initiator family protein [Roseovarius sp. 10]